VYLFIADFANNRIFRIDANTRIITVVAPVTACQRRSATKSDVQPNNKMKFARVYCALACFCGVGMLMANAAAALYFPLQSTQIREAFLLGHSGDISKINAFFETYTHRLPAHAESWTVESIELRTPYEQVVRRAWEHPSSGYDLDHAEKDYAAQPELLLVRLIVSATADSPTSLSSVPSPQTQTGSAASSWKGLRFTVSQSRTILPKKLRAQSLYAGRVGKGTKTEILLEFDASQFASEFTRVHVAMPDGSSGSADFDLSTLK
jgi:hypothetical protein